MAGEGVDGDELDSLASKHARRAMASPSSRNSHPWHWQAIGGRSGGAVPGTRCATDFISPPFEYDCQPSQSAVVVLRSYGLSRETLYKIAPDRSQQAALIAIIIPEPSEGSLTVESCVTTILRQRLANRTIVKHEPC